LRNFAKSEIYSTALPPCILAAAIASLKIIKQKKLLKQLLENVQYFCDLMSLSKSQSAIVPIIIGDNKKVIDIAKKIAAKGFLVGAIRSPTVEPKKSRLRITFSAMHKKHQIKKLASALKKELISE
jgi:7-keto-8-aminopelargonate synthetase-like enzyme